MNYGKKSARQRQTELSSKKAMKKKRIGVTLFKSALVCMFLLFIAVGAIAFSLIKSVIDNAPSNVDVRPKAYSTTIYDKDGNELERLVESGSNRIYKDIDEIPEHVRNAFVAIEDERFYEHNGIDIRGIVRAGVKGISAGSFSEGASTITQQLLKNNVFTGWTEENTLRDRAERKLQEQYLALQIEKEMDKDEILQHYLNTINLGQNTLGVQAASRRYFGKDIEELSLSEGAVIAGITKNPTKYNPVTNPEENSDRRVLVLTNMLEQGYITQTEYDEALADNVYARIQDFNDEFTSSTYSYFVDALIDQVTADLMEELGYSKEQAQNALYSGGLTIKSSLDPWVQSVLDAEFQDESNYPAGTIVELNFALTVQRANGDIENFSHNQMENVYLDSNPDYNRNYDNEEAAMAAYEQYKAEIVQIGEGDEIAGEKIYLVPQPQASMVLIDQETGHVKALVGGRGEKSTSRSLNRAYTSVRQPGSIFKILATYAPALDTAGMTLATVQDDAEYNYETGRKVNNWYGDSYKGYCTIRYGIEQSLNIVAVKTLTDITPQLGYDTLINFGFTSIVDQRVNADGTVYSDIGQPLALGGLTDGVSNIEVTAAFAAIANGGEYHAPKLYTEILDHEGNAILDNTEPASSRVIKDTTAALLTNAMEDVVTKGTGKGLSIPNMPVAGKTGSTTDDKDIWFAGYSPYYTCTVWTGYDNSAELPSGYTTFYKTLWQKVMARLHEDLPKKEFEMPSSLVTATICKKSGKLAVSGICDADPRGSMAIQEYFAPGTKPTESCDHHVKASICGISHQQAGEFCPHSARTEGVFMVRGDDSAGTTDDSAYQLPGPCTLHNSASDLLEGGEDDDDLNDDDLDDDDWDWDWGWEDENPSGTPGNNNGGNGNEGNTEGGGGQGTGTGTGQTPLTSISYWWKKKLYPFSFW